MALRLGRGRAVQSARSPKQCHGPRKRAIQAPLAPSRMAQESFFDPPRGRTASLRLDGRGQFSTQCHGPRKRAAPGEAGHPKCSLLLNSVMARESGPSRRHLLRLEWLKSLFLILLAAARPHCGWMAAGQFSTQCHGPRKRAIQAPLAPSRMAQESFFDPPRGRSTSLRLDGRGPILHAMSWPAEAGHPGATCSVSNGSRVFFDPPRGRSTSLRLDGPLPRAMTK